MKLALWLLSVLAIPVWAEAEDEFPYKWNAYGFYAGGSSVGENQARSRGGGGGAEAFVWRRLAVGGDVSAFQDYYYRAVGTFGHAGANAVWHFADREKEKGADPFVLFGVGRHFPEESTAVFHGGAGLTYWFHRHFGIRGEIRFGGRDYGDNIVGVFRIGVAVR